MILLWQLKLSWRLIVLFSVLPLCFMCQSSKDGSSADQATHQATDQTFQIEKIVSTILSWSEETIHKTRPFVTISYAQSLDGKIALRPDKEGSDPSSNLPLSGPESLLMTHALRSIHDAILVGGRTLAIDNPRLSNRLWKLSNRQPRPVVLDTNLQCIQMLGSDIRSRKLIICCSHKAHDNISEKLQHSDITLLPCRTTEDGTLDLQDVLLQLFNTFHIRSIMVEGGGKVLSTFAKESIIDCVCCTVSPKILGSHGLEAFSDLQFFGKASRTGLSLNKAICMTLGEDGIFLGLWNTRID